MNINIYVLVAVYAFARLLHADDCSYFDKCPHGKHSCPDPANQICISWVKEGGYQKCPYRSICCPLGSTHDYLTCVAPTCNSQSDCDPTAICSGSCSCSTHAIPSNNYVGSELKCKCPNLNGWKQQGNQCIDIDECAIPWDDPSYPCAYTAICTNTPGGYSCKCHERMIGDGKTCTPNYCATSKIYDDQDMMVVCSEKGGQCVEPLATCKCPTDGLDFDPSLGEYCDDFGNLVRRPQPVGACQRSYKLAPGSEGGVDNYDSASALCGDKGLATIEIQNEYVNDFASAYQVIEAAGLGFNDPFWIGGKSDGSGEPWKWFDGTNVADGAIMITSVPPYDTYFCSEFFAGQSGNVKCTASPDIYRGVLCNDECVPLSSTTWNMKFENYELITIILFVFMIMNVMINFYMCCYNQRKGVRNFKYDKVYTGSV